MTSESKLCVKCGKVKTLDQFYVRRASSDGLRHECKKCTYECQRRYNERKLLMPRKQHELYDRVVCDYCKFRPTCDVRVRQTDEEHWDWMPPCFITSHLHEAYVKEYGNGRKQDYISERVQV